MTHDRISDDESPESGATQDAGLNVDSAVSTRQCLGAGFVRKPDYVERARKLLDGKMRVPPHPEWASEDLTNWVADPFKSRNWKFQHHALRWISPARHLAMEGDREARDFWMSTVLSWISSNPPESPSSKFAWIDMADGMRAQEIVFGWPLAESQEEQQALVAALEVHGEWLADEKNLSEGNHALHQNIGLFVLASFLRRQDWQDLSIRRMLSLFDASFDVNGANNEGSVEYHRLNLAWWKASWDRIELEGIEVPRSARLTLERAAVFLAHATRPDGFMMTIGDTHLKPVERSGWPEVDYVASLGAEGTPPSATAITAPNGFIFGRSGWGGEGRSYKEETTYSLRYGPRIRSHQHDDRGSITYYSGGEDWLTDPGSYNYEPKDRFRKYLRSRAAHNLVVIDGREYNPAGHVRLERSTVSDHAHDYSVVDSNYEGVVLTRRLVYLPGLDLGIVIDRFTADEQVTAKQLWHLNPRVRGRLRDSAVEVQGHSGRSLGLQWLGHGERPVVTYAGEKSPVGWVSRAWGKKEPGAVVEVSKTARTGSFTSVFADSTEDTWSVVSSRATPTSTWIRALRFGRIWSITIGDDGISITEDESRSALMGGANLNAAAIMMREDRWIRQRFADLDDRLSRALAKVEESATPSPMATVSEASIEKRIAALETKLSDATHTLNESVQQEHQRIARILPHLPAGMPLDTVLGGLPLGDVTSYIEDPLFIYELWSAGTPGLVMNLGQRRKLFRELYQRGYYSHALEVIRGIAAVTEREKDQLTAQIRGSELSMLRGELSPVCTEPEEGFSPVTGRILHVVGKALPETQTGYTLRTHYLAQAQVEKGYDVHVMRQAGASVDSLDESPVIRDGVTYHLPEGPARGTITWDEWLQNNTDALRQLVIDERPSILHCHSDYINQLIARPVADAFGLPLIYESRGFWEESWLSRVETAVGRPLDADNERYGFPDAYTLRHDRENQARTDSDHVTTLAEVMRDHIVERGEDPSRISVTPNGVLPSDFPVVETDAALKDQLGFPADVPVIGYITSVVEYEGIDTLVTAFARLIQAGRDTRLLIVGDGPVRASLVAQAKNLGIADRCLFTGRVPHEQVLAYYSLIDIFVVPRKDRAVCRLVTPLKPFEAFSTGRTVVVSDVDALREIADQSGGAELFRADDPDSLAQVLSALLDDPQRRSELASRGAAWVREERSWRSIADRYDEPYQKLGVQRFRLLADYPQQVPDVAKAAQRRQASTIGNRGEAVALLQLHGADGVPTDSARAHQTVETGWAAYGFDPAGLDFPIDWRNVGPDDRSWRMHFHCWEFMHAPLMEWARTGDESFLRWCLDRALSWSAEFADLHDDSTMAWYDMAIAYRTMVLITLLRAAEVSNEVSDDEYAALLIQAFRQRDGHWADASFNPRNNHGYYSAVSQLVLGRELSDLPGMPALRGQGEDRLRLMTEGQFMPDGGHSEHSPDYHRMLLSGFDAALAAGVIEDPAVSAVVSAAADALGWMIQPDGCLVQFGDSAQRKMVGKGLTSSSPTTQWVLSGGMEGEASQSSALVLPETGYVFVRESSAHSPGQFAKDSYLAFTSAFHSRAHKHSDDNTMVWFEEGQQILCDGGRYRYGELLAPDSPLRDQAFYYADPVRQFMETAAPHSTISVDGTLHDRRREPHGSGLVEAHQDAQGQHIITARTPQAGWVHHRTVGFLPGQHLISDDLVEFEDGEEHEISLWWHFDGSLELEVIDDRLLLRSPQWEGRQLELTTTLGESPEILYGSEDPLGGWRSRVDRVKEESWQVRWRVAAQEKLSLETRMEFRPTSG
ncbi:UNVERIFIED_CONTAM: heparinase II/III family protein [Kocuria sp. CPCC 205295]|uniref:heparinase II/III domain-containing protein n=1 Tax=unclassified Kocuria TaxID=2649579 RepID=UPI0034D3E27F